jgi:hypothetical protein
MYDSKTIVGYCGVYCGTCPTSQYVRRKQNLARQLKRLIDEGRDEYWLPEVVKSFNFEEFRKGLEFYTEMCCPGCREMEVPDEDWCERRKCAKERGVHTCFECAEIEACEPMKYIRETYPFILERYYVIFKEKGYDGVLDEMESDRAKGFDTLEHLAMQYCKRVELNEPFLKGGKAEE